jgi:hypothetical protein
MKLEDVDTVKAAAMLFAAAFGAAILLYVWDSTLGPQVNSLFKPKAAGATA